MLVTKADEAHGRPGVFLERVGGVQDVHGLLNKAKHLGCAWRSATASVVCLASGPAPCTLADGEHRVNRLPEARGKIEIGPSDKTAARRGAPPWHPRPTWSCGREGTSAFCLSFPWPAWRRQRSLARHAQGPARDRTETERENDRGTRAAADRRLVAAHGSRRAAQEALVRLARRANPAVYDERSTTADARHRGMQQNGNGNQQGWVQQVGPTKGAQYVREKKGQRVKKQKAESRKQHTSGGRPGKDKTGQRCQTHKTAPSSGCRCFCGRGE